MQTDTEPPEVACNETAIFEQAFLKHNWITSVEMYVNPRQNKIERCIASLLKVRFAFSFLGQ